MLLVRVQYSIKRHWRQGLQLAPEVDGTVGHATKAVQRTKLIDRMP
jgi:hypothetical protein